MSPFPQNILTPRSQTCLSFRIQIIFLNINTMNTHYSKYPALLFSAFLILSIYSCKKNASRSDNPQIPDIDVAEAYMDSIVLSNTYPGVLQAATIADVVGRVNGQLLTQCYSSGDYVQTGQVLFTIESTPYRDAVDKARSALTTAESEYQYYSKQYNAMQKALEADAVSKMEVLQAKNNMEQSLAAIQSAKANLNDAQRNLSYCIVRAPISGHITSTKYDPGNYIAGGGAPVVLATIYNNSELLATFSLSDTQYEELIGQSGGISDEIYRNVPVRFREPLKRNYFTNLTYESPTVNSKTGTITLRGIIKNPDNELKDGMYVTIDLPYGVAPHAVIVKEAAISSDQLGKYLYTVNDSDKVVYTPVKTGQLYQDSLRVIESGIRPGTRYVTKALLSVKPGERIKPIVR